MTTLGDFFCTHGMRFPTPWITAGDEMPALAAGIAAEAAPITVFSLRTRKEFVLREVAEALEDGRDVLEVLNRLLLADGYVMTMAFETAGSNAVVTALAEWAREEATMFPRVSRGKGAVLPFDRLKWLAALRLEEARQAAGLSFGEVQRMLRQHELTHPLVEAAPQLPIYASHGAWSKPIGDARKWLPVLDREPMLFERRVLGWCRHVPVWPGIPLLSAAHAAHRQRDNQCGNCRRRGRWRTTNCSTRVSRVHFGVPPKPSSAPRHQPWMAR